MNNLHKLAEKLECDVELHYWWRGKQKYCIMIEGAGIRINILAYQLKHVISKAFKELSKHKCWIKNK